MIKSVYSVKDYKTGFGPLMLFDNDVVAMRSFSISVQQTDSLMHWCAPDYSLYCIGQFDDDAGALMPLPTPQHIMDAVDVPKAGE